MTRTKSKTPPAMTLLAAAMLAVCTPGAMASDAPAPGASPVDATPAVLAAERDAHRAMLLAAAERPGDPFGDALLALTLRLFAKPPPPDVPAAALPAPAIPDVALTLAADRLEAGAASRGDQDWRALAVLLMSMPRGPEADAIASRLLGAAPDNAFAYVAAMANAWNADSPGMFVGWAHHSGKATGYRSVYPAAPAALQQRLGAAATPDGLAWAFQVAGAYTLPAYQNFSKPCRAAEGALAERCLHVATLMMREGDSWIDAAIGTSVVEALGDETLRAEATASKREREWQMDAWRVLAPELEKDPAQIARFADELAAHGEVVAARHLLAAEGIPLAPPPDWRSAEERRAAAGED